MKKLECIGRVTGHRQNQMTKDFHFLSHSILVSFLHRAQFALKIDTDFEVQISDVPGIWLHLEHSCHLLTLLACEVVVQVEHSLFPVSVWSLWSRRKSNPLVAFGELDIEESDQSLAIVIPLQLQVEGAGEGDILLGACLNVYLLDETGVGDDLIPVDTIHQWFCEGNLPDAGHVEPVDIVPPGDLVILVLPVLNPTHIKCGFVWEHQPTLGQPLIPGVQHGVEHGLVEQAVAHPLGDDDVNLVHPSRQLDLLHLPPDDGDCVTQAIILDNLLGMVHYRTHIHSNNLGSSSFSSEHGEDASPTTHIKHHLPFEQVLVVPHGVSVGQSANFIFQHLLVNTKMCVGVKIIVLAGHFFCVEKLHLLHV